MAPMMQRIHGLVASSLPWNALRLGLFAMDYLGSAAATLGSSG